MRGRNQRKQRNNRMPDLIVIPFPQINELNKYGKFFVLRQAQDAYAQNARDNYLNSEFARMVLVFSYKECIAKKP